MNKQLLVEQIQRAGYSQRSLAKELKMSKNTLNSKVNGHVPFTTLDIQRICNKIGLSNRRIMAEIFLSDKTQ
ncbi:hypothetical protein LJC49_09230 [Ruminococcaceae bacterium OttesenSCG-928-I18]|nr:hypothetical protein [Ruminococcaceae bacterium OttesenSCG-928-I18]